MPKGEVIFDERYCRGCALCAHFCARGCISIPGDRFTPQGYLLPLFFRPEHCNACGICGWMCPHFAIEVFRLEDRPAAA